MLLWLRLAKLRYVDLNARLEFFDLIEPCYFEITIRNIGGSFTFRSKYHIGTFNSPFQSSKVTNALNVLVR